ncbi:hypothetical protein HDV00_000790 [Rhizophlyctis rosea]|nr:hypothetical protein HDV00_000790 [Rhizophlyctis rosea]
MTSLTATYTSPSTSHTITRPLNTQTPLSDSISQLRQSLNTYFTSQLSQSQSQPSEVDKKIEEDEWNSDSEEEEVGGGKANGAQGGRGGKGSAKKRRVS